MSRYAWPYKPEAFRDWETVGWLIESRCDYEGLPLRGALTAHTGSRLVGWGDDPDVVMLSFVPQFGTEETT